MKEKEYNEISALGMLHYEKSKIKKYQILSAVEGGVILVLIYILIGL